MDFLNPLRKYQLKNKKVNIYKRLDNNMTKATKLGKEVADQAAKISVPRKAKKIMCIVASIIIAFLLSVYLPVLILGDEPEIYYSLAYDSSALSINEDLARNYPDDDFDGDGLTNEQEYDNDTDIFNFDTDGDGLSDYDEVNTLNTNPLKANKKKLAELTEDEDIDANLTINSPFSDEGLVMWADSYKYKASATVVKEFNCYLIQDFKGWVQFPDSKNKYIYQKVNGKYKTMKYKETENAYYIDEDCEVYVLSNELTYSYTLTFAKYSVKFNNNIFGNILAFILPDSGRTWLKCSKTAEFETDDSDTTTLISSCKYTNSIEERISKQTNQLSDLATVWNTIYNKKCVYVSFYKEEKGESVGIVYGYTADGDLLIADPETGQYAGKLSISFNAKKIYLNEELQKIMWFEFEGLGFNSQDGDRINFFGAENDDDYIDYFS